MNLLKCLKHFRRGWALLEETLREIFDENAYQRYLKRHGAEVTAESYAAFLAENKERALKAPRCC